MPHLTSSRISEIVTAVVTAAKSKDPVTNSVFDAAIHPGVQAAVAHHIAYDLHCNGHRKTARIVAALARIVTGVDIHPAARIDETVFIDHALGVVIGETATVKSGAMLYHNVTLGSIGWWKDRELSPRHPTIGHDSIICTGAAVLGPVILGDNVIVGSHAVVLADVPDGTHVPAGSVWSSAVDRAPALVSTL